jgi:DNA gyrase subunit B/topoisomerase-4 subunit B
MPDKSYTGKDIQVLEGLEPVRKRPGMYIGGTGQQGLHHLLWELVDNAVVEATNGYASITEVTLHADGKSCTVTDNGRGIPIDEHPTKKISTLELILTTLHSGGKFDDTNYITSGGLHGVGSSVVNALSEEMRATVKRDGRKYEQRYAKGIPVTEVKEVDDDPRGTGTSIYFRPDPGIFESVAFDPKQILRQLEVKTYLNASLRIVFIDETTGERHELKHDGGIAEYLEAQIEKAEARPVHEEPFFVREGEETGERIEVVIQWTEDPKRHIVSYVNGIPTEDGGTHEQGFRDGVVRAIRSYMETHDLTSRGLDITADDIREGLFAMISIYMKDPQFQGQTKEKLNNPGIRSTVTNAFRLQLEQYLNAHPSTGEAVAARVIQAARAREASRAAGRKVSRKRSVSHRLNLPGKLADCASTDPGLSELFIVEGDSAGGSAKQARDRESQAVLPLRGKVLNAEQATSKRVSQNKELQNIIKALGCGIGNNVDLERLRYGKIILLMDADSDGHHIATLLLTFFYRYMKPLVDEGHIYIAQPPLYRIAHGKSTYWALDDADKEKIVGDIEDQYKNPTIDIQRFKGLGEMMPATLKETTLDVKKRRLLQVTIPDDERLTTEETVSQLMGRDSSARFEFIMNHAGDVGDVEELDV